MNSNLKRIIAPIKLPTTMSLIVDSRHHNDIVCAVLFDVSTSTAGADCFYEFFPPHTFIMISLNELESPLVTNVNS